MLFSYPIWSSFFWFLFNLFFIFFIDFFFNFAPHHLVSFNFYVKFNPHSFDYCLFIFFPIPNWILWSLNIWFQIIFISSLVLILFVFFLLFFFHCIFFQFHLSVFYWFKILLLYFLGFAFNRVGLGLMIRVKCF